MNAYDARCPFRGVEGDQCTEGMTDHADVHQWGDDDRWTKKLLRGPRAHSVAWMLEDDNLGGIVKCHATEGADCRMTCLEGCESWDLEHEHPLHDSGKCNFVDWMEAVDGVLDSHIRSHAPTDGFIEFEFDDDHYVWWYVGD